MVVQVVECVLPSMLQSDSAAAEDCREDRQLVRDSAANDCQHGGNETCLS